VVAVSLKKKRYQGYGRKRKLVSEEDVSESSFDEWCKGKVASPGGAARGTLMLETREAPHPPLDPPGKWVNADDFADFSDKEFDYAGAIQKAIDSGATTVFIGRGGSPKSTVVVRGKVRWLLGFYNAMWWAGPKNESTPVFRLADGESPVVVFDKVGVNQYSRPGMGVEHASKRTLVLRHTNLRYRNTVEGGTVFLEDWCGGRAEFKGQTVYGRQMNPEAKVSPILSFENSRAWILGFKTEYGNRTLDATKGSKVDVIGGYHYHKGELLYKAVDSELSVVFPASYPGYRNFLEITRAGRTETLPRQGCTVVRTDP
jgi:hypothetical protein